MATCRNCGAELSPDIDWCPRCYEPVVQPQSAQQGDLVEPGEPGEREDEVLPAPEYSAWKAGPYSFGPVGKIVITTVIVAIGIGVAWGAARIASFYGTAGLALVMVFIGIYAVLAVLGLWGLWRPTRVK